MRPEDTEPGGKSVVTGVIPTGGLISVKLERGQKGGHAWEIRAEACANEERDMLDTGRELVDLIEAIEKDIKERFPE